MPASKKVIERFTKLLPRFQQIVKNARDRDVNESDTVVIISDIFADILGYDKYLEVTREFAIKGTFCDLAVKINDKIQFIIEVKAVGIELKDQHIKQACDYGANQGVQWVVLTNGIDWKVYRIRFEQPIGFDMVYQFKLPDINLKSENDIDLLFTLSKEGLSSNSREVYYEKIQSVNRFMVGNIMLREEILSVVRKELKKIAVGIKVEIPEIENIILHSVFKREIIEGEEAEVAKKRISKFYKKVNIPAKKAPVNKQLEVNTSAEVNKPTEETPDDSSFEAVEDSAMFNSNPQ
ncbi:MAG: type I restriction enzyme HsdR N-terminal domain-containing protein [Chitinispirillales bacterium]|jgi:hypothetical protein|nr:type I restriction enzyme HsdR N-terminal domain-containing protein [Chitinispirillales bacterium]